MARHLQQSYSDEFYLKAEVDIISQMAEKDIAYLIAEDGTAYLMAVEGTAIYLSSLEAVSFSMLEFTQMELGCYSICLILCVIVNLQFS